MRTRNISMQLSARTIAFWLAIVFILLLLYKFKLSPEKITDSKKKLADAPSEITDSEKFVIPIVKDAVAIKSDCPAHKEFANVDFFDDKMRSHLCSDTPAFTLVNGKFPPCKLPWNLPLTRLVSPSKVKLPDAFDTKNSFTIYAHKGEYLTEQLRVREGHWETCEVKVLLSLVKLIGSDETTFLDIGCNIGVYALQSGLRGIPTVCVDANIRNLVRVLMSAKNFQLKQDKNFQIYWAFFDNKIGIQRFRYISRECHVGAATPFLPKSESFEDPVPVSAIKGDDLVGRMPTSQIVMKIDIESFEPAYLSTAIKFFDTYKIVAVQMEIYRNNYQPKLETEFIENFFFSRGFKLFTTKLKQGNLTHWTGTHDSLWVHRDYVALLDKIEMYPGCAQ